MKLQRPFPRLRNELWVASVVRGSGVHEEDQGVNDCLIRRPFGPGDDDSRDDRACAKAAMHRRGNRGPVMGDEHPVVPHGVVQDVVVTGPCQTQLLNGDDVEPWPRFAQATEEVVAGVFTPEKAGYCPGGLRVVVREPFAGASRRRSFVVC